MPIFRKLSKPGDQRAPGLIPIIYSDKTREITKEIFKVGTVMSIYQRYIQLEYQTYLANCVRDLSSRQFFQPPCERRTPRTSLRSVDKRRHRNGRGLGTGCLDRILRQGWTWTCSWGRERGEPCDSLCRLASRPPGKSRGVWRPRLQACHGYCFKAVEAFG